MPTNTIFSHWVTCTLLTAMIISCNATPEIDPIEAYLDLPLEERQKAVHAVDAMQLPAGLEVNLFAAEPMVINPTNMAIDAKGRVWVCESYNYAVPKAEQTETGGRIIILEDTDGDGRADDRKVFYQDESVHLALGISVYGNKVYVARSPNMLVFTDSNGDDQPDQIDTLFTGMGNPGDHSAHALVFGPDGKYYFNFGNAGIQVNAKDGTPIIDKEGNRVIAHGKPYHGGMVFRCDTDGSNFEVLGHNFRNNYEVAVDAYGNLWQSDNDDDGNRGVRINYVMAHGNYGYLDEYTGAHWGQPRTAMHDSIPMRHWHQNDPGVVPNLLHTGAGSPTGIAVYEGKLLPSQFQGQIIHADAGPNVVRAYPRKAIGAGYTAHMEPIMKNNHDQWFRPVDVAVAPDGSLFAADWYDPVVGGAAAGDHQKGRIFRIAPKRTPYQIKHLDIQTNEDAVAALVNPNDSRRYLGWQHLATQKEAAIPQLEKVFEADDPAHRARALWLLGHLPKGLSYFQKAMQDPSPEIRKAAIRLAFQQKWPIQSFAKAALEDNHSGVRATMAIGLRPINTPEANAIWAQLAQQYDGHDRWYLEALGIGADLYWDDRFAAWEKLGKQQQPAARRIVWRARCEAALPYLVDIIQSESLPSDEVPKYFRAFDFHRSSKKNDVLISLLENSNLQIQGLILQHLDPENLPSHLLLNEALVNVLDHQKGSMAYVQLVRKFGLTKYIPALTTLVLESKNDEVRQLAMATLMNEEGFNAHQHVADQILKLDSLAIPLIQTLGGVANRPSLTLLQSLTLKEELSINAGKAAVQALGNSWWGEDFLMEAVEDPRFKSALKPTAARVLFSVYRTSIHDRAAQYLDRPTTADGKQLPALRDLVATIGNPAKGAQVFETYCQTCHVINGNGISFGPELSIIGDKLSKEGLLRSIMYPSEGVNHGFETHQIEMEDGVAVGLLASDSQNEVVLKLVGGASQVIPKSKILKRTILPQSLMPNLTIGMTMEELIDLVTYLEGLKDQTL